MKEVALVVPSIRENCLSDFIQAWRPTGLFERVQLFVMEDNPQKTFDVKSYGNEDIIHYCWEDIHKDLGGDSWIIPRRSDTVRSYAYLKAYQYGYPFIMTLDDDCYPEPGFEYLDEMHKKYLTGRPYWFNTLNRVKPRGIPFNNVGDSRPVYVNHGLWTEVLDYDAPTQLAAPTEEEFSYDNRIVPQNSFFPFCGMNAMWRREATVLMYHLLQGSMMDVSMDVSMVPEKLPFDRFGDIWCGLFMKVCADILGWNVSTGTPYIKHKRASNPFTNLRKEANGIEVNESLWEHLLAIKSKMLNDGVIKHPVELYAQLGKEIGTLAAHVYTEYSTYFYDLSDAMYIWASKFRIDVSKNK